MYVTILTNTLFILQILIVSFVLCKRVSMIPIEWVLQIEYNLRQYLLNEIELREHHLHISIFCITFHSMLQT